MLHLTLVCEGRGSYLAPLSPSLQASPMPRPSSRSQTQAPVWWNFSRETYYRLHKCSRKTASCLNNGIGGCASSITIISAIKAVEQFVFSFRSELTWS